MWTLGASDSGIRLAARELYFPGYYVVALDVPGIFGIITTYLPGTNLPYGFVSVAAIPSTHPHFPYGWDVLPD